MTAPLFYWSFLALCSLYILARGGAPERAGIIIAIVASVLTVVAGTREIAARFTSMETGIFVVDLCALAAFLVLAARADRYWPLWVAGVHMVGVVTHGAMVIDPTMVPRVYAFAQALWCYPILAVMVIGTIRHRRRLARDGVDRSWVPSWRQSTPVARENGPTG